MSNDPEIRCPVCRARQSLRETCRRCEADLGLVMRAHRRLAYIEDQLAQARTNGDHNREQQLSGELRWFAPSR